MINLPDKYLGPTTTEHGMRYRINNQYFSHESRAIAYLIKCGMSTWDADLYIKILYREYNSHVSNLGL